LIFCELDPLPFTFVASSEFNPDVVVDVLGASEGTGIVKVEGKLRPKTSLFLESLDLLDFEDFEDFEDFILRWVLS